MSFFNFGNKKNTTSAQAGEIRAPRPSIRELQARAYEQWVSQGVAERERRPSGFSEARAARIATHDNALVMGY